MLIDGLADLAPSGGGERPVLDVLARTAGATVVRLGFRAGQAMREHRADRPILLTGQQGELEIRIGDNVIRLCPGVAVHIDAGVTHALSAAADAVVTLLILERAQPGPGDQPG
ncbi:XRE family transcriptional regulator [Skermania piniformis]|uniref:XRE family transcriptional regulator n=1 Tax=Skermania pinensis TaxID=39122 RepID=A0ABX8SD63_9ACTN|nr:XRE family transcriptional regulator [Skermania piniformis]